MPNSAPATCRPGVLRVCWARLRRAINQLPPHLRDLQSYQGRVAMESKSKVKTRPP